MEEEKSLIDRKELRKKLAIRAAIYCTLGVIIVIGSALTGIVCAELTGNSYNYNNNRIIPQNIIEDEIVQEEIKEKPLPFYSEEAKEKINNIYKENGEEKIAYLTFDDGPSKNITPQILEILKKEDIKASFFVLGSRVELYPELVRQEYEEGHYIANHGFSHDYKSIYSSPQATLDEYNRTEKTIQEALENPDYHTYIFRFPGGSEGGKYKKIKNDAKKVLEENNVIYINWNALTRDAEGSPTKESLINDLKATVGNKKRVVILMHDASTKQLTADTLPEVIQYLREEGFAFKNFYDIMSKSE